MAAAGGRKWWRWVGEGLRGSGRGLIETIASDQAFVAVDVWRPGAGSFHPWSRGCGSDE
jgi:hypothetical protein